MKSFIAPVVLCALISGCGPKEPDVASAFRELGANKVEIRMGYLPELGDAVCDRNMYAGYRSDQAEAVTFTLNMVVKHPGKMESYERQLTLEPIKKSGILAGQARLFPAPIETSCSNVDVKMTTMSCTYGPDNEQRACPRNITWQWLQGFKMIATPTAN